MTPATDQWADNGRFREPRRPAGDPQECIVDALREMLRLAEGGSIDVTGDPHGGVAMVMEYENVRCVLVVKAPTVRHTLSPREQQIARLVAEGSTNRMIASTLEISLWTVSTHIRRVFVKLDVRSRAEMVARLFGSSSMISNVADAEEPQAAAVRRPR